MTTTRLKQDAASARAAMMEQMRGGYARMLGKIEDLQPSKEYITQENSTQTLNEKPIEGKIPLSENLPLAEKIPSKEKISTQKTHTGNFSSSGKNSEAIFPLEEKLPREEIETTGNFSPGRKVSLANFPIEENLPIQENCPLEEKLSVYEGACDWLFQAAVKAPNAAAIGFLALLDRVIPVGGGILRVGSFARAIKFEISSVRKALDKLVEQSLIESISHGLDGRWIRLSCRDDSGQISATGNLSATGKLSICSSVVFKNYTTTSNDEGKVSDSGNLSATGKLSPSGNFSDVIRERKRVTALESIFIAVLSTGKPPEDLPKQILSRLVNDVEEKGVVSVIAFIREYLPQAKINAPAYLARILDANAEPSPSKIAEAKKIEDALSSFKLSIGNEILPSDWCKLVRIFGINVKPDDAIKAQQSIIARLEVFLSN